MSAEMFDADVMAFMTGGVSTEELARRRQEKIKKDGIQVPSFFYLLFLVSVTLVVVVVFVAFLPAFAFVCCFC